MRLVKLSTKEFPQEAALLAFFNQVLWGRNPPGLFQLPSGWIGEVGLDKGETLLFTYRGRLRFVAKAETGRMDNIYMPNPAYPYCFVVDRNSLRQADVPVEEVERQLRDKAGLQKSLQAHGWTKIPDSESAEAVINTLAIEAKTAGAALAWDNPGVAGRPCPNEGRPRRLNGAFGGGERMADVQKQQRPKWVRLAVPAGTKRQVAKVQIGCIVLITGIGLLVTALGSGSSSFLGAVELPVGLGLAVMGGGAALWSWLAVRWVDRNGKWGKQPNKEL
jgi:hypothetical protein